MTLVMGYVGAKMLALGAIDPAPTGPKSEPALPVVSGRDHSPQSLVFLLAKVAERVRTDPEANFAHCAVRGAARVLSARLDDRMGLCREAARDAAEGP